MLINKSELNTLINVLDVNFRTYIGQFNMHLEAFHASVNVSNEYKNSIENSFTIEGKTINKNLYKNEKASYLQEIHQDIRSQFHWILKGKDINQDQRTSDMVYTQFDKPNYKTLGENDIKVTKINEEEFNLKTSETIFKLFKSQLRTFELLLTLNYKKYIHSFLPELTEKQSEELEEVFKDFVNKFLIEEKNLSPIKKQNYLKPNHPLIEDLYQPINSLNAKLHKELKLDEIVITR